MNVLNNRFYCLVSILILCFWVSATNVAQAQCMTSRCSDSLALVSFYNQSNGASWTTKWDLTKAMTTWTGVTLTGSGSAARVTKLEVKANKVSGTLSTKLGDLSELTVLDLSDNAITGALPKELSTLKKLVTLNISKNKITKVNDISAITTLSVLNFSVNQLDFGSIEPYIKVGTYVFSPQDSIGRDTTIVLDEYGSLTLTPSIGGSANLYQWLKDGVLQGAALATNNTLSIVDAKRTSDQGVYVLRITSTLVTGLQLHTRRFTIKINGCKISGSSVTLKETSYCEGKNTPTITGTTPTGSKGKITFIWQRSLDEKTWTDVGDESDFKPSGIAQNNFFRRIAGDGRCIGDTSNTIKITFVPKMTNNTISKNYVICEGDSARTIQGSLPIGGSGKYIYQWQSSKNKKDWKNEEKGRHFKPIGNKDTTYFRRVADDALCFKDTSTSVSIIILSSKITNFIGKNQSICPNGKIAFLADTATLVKSKTFKIDSINYKYSWQASTDQKKWTRADTLTKADTMTRLYPQKIIISTYFRRIITNVACGKKDTSNITLITVYPKIRNNAIASDIGLVCEGDTTKVNLVGTNPIDGGGAYKYTWQSSLDKKNWNNRSDSANVVFTEKDITDTTFFRRIVRSLCYNDTSKTAFVIKGYKFGENTIGNSQIRCSNDTSKFELKGTKQIGKGSFRFEWQTSPDSINWAKIDSFGNAQNYNPPLKFLKKGFFYYRRMVFGICQPDTSNTISLDLVDSLENNEIDGSQLICQGDSVAKIIGKTPRGGGGNYQYLWQASIDNKEWALADTSLSFKPIGITKTTFYRRVVVSRQCNPDTSEVVEIRIIQKLSNNQIKDNQEICLGARADTLRGSTPIGGDSTYIYVWQQSISDSTWKTVSSKKDYAADIITTAKFRRLVFSSCFSDTSNVVTLNINERVRNNQILSPQQTICRGTKADTLRGSTPLDNVGVFKFQWQLSKNRRQWTNIGFGLGKDLAPDSPDSTTHYRRIATNLCFSDTSLSQTIRILQKPNIDAGKDTIVNVGLSILLRATGGVSYKWTPKETLSDSLSASPIAKPIRTTTYVVVGTDAAGCTNTDSVTVRVAADPIVRVVDIITPNGDGVNDILYVENLDLYPDNTLIVFNRWGQIIFEKKDYRNDWDGTLDGKQIPTGVYFYIIKFAVTSRVKKGSFTLLN